MNPVLLLLLALALAVVGIVVMGKIAWLGFILLILAFAGFLLAMNRHRRDIER